NFCFVVDFTHDGTKLEDSKSRGVVQLAILYTTPEQKRRLRIHNVCLQAKEDPTLLLQSFDALAVASTYARSLALHLPEASLAKCREVLVQELVGAYRGFLKHKSQLLQLQQQLQLSVVPEPLDLLLLYCCSLLKSPSLMQNRPLDRGIKEPYVRADSR